jgi:hypothetical protein
MLQTEFSFVPDPVLKSSIDEVFEHIARLLEVVDDKDYPAEAKSAFCKSIIIHTGSIIEALLYVLLDIRYSDDNIKQHYATWQLKPFHKLHTLDNTHQIVAGEYKLIPGKQGKTKLNLAQTCDFLKLKGDITPDIHKKVTKVRTLRNEQHLATQTRVRSCTRKDVKDVFKIAREVKEFVRGELS